LPGETPTEVVFVDPAVPDYQTLLAGMDPNIEVIMLEGGRDGMECQLTCETHRMECGNADRDGTA
jgi:hypothetical protein